VVGHDPDPALAGAAKKAGAVDRTEWNLINAVTGADRVLLALPLDQVRDTLKAIAADLSEGCVVVDTANVKAPVIAWAAELLPKAVYFVGGHPILLGEGDAGSARADLFDKKLFCLTPGATTDASAVRLAADLAEALGAQPFFLDPAEHDGMMAAVEHLPQLLSGALADVVSRSSGWRDLRKVAGSQFYAGTWLTQGSGGTVAATLASNREQVAHWLDALIARLNEWRDLLAEGNEGVIAQAVNDGMSERQRWIQASLSGNWDEDLTAVSMPTAGGMWRDFFGFDRFRKAPDSTKRK
jgi:prephenate dehydrogenase